MATITKRQGKTGTRYSAQIRIKRGGKIIHSEARTFDARKNAERWATRRELELEAPGAIERAQSKGLTIGKVLEWYLEDFDGATKFGRSKLSHINYLLAHPTFPTLDAVHLTSAQLVKHARERHNGGAKPPTINNDFIWLTNAFQSASIGRGAPVARDAVKDAAYLCKKEGLIGKSKRRDRRPTVEEIELLLEHFTRVSARWCKLPMLDIIPFAIFSSRRQEEITELRWEDLDRRRGGILVRDMKHPREKVDTFVMLPERALAIIDKQEQDGPLIFPYKSKSVSSAFTNACKLLGIKDLRFHDLRHEAASHLFELGWDIPRVAQVTGHKSWATLQRYTHIQEDGQFDKWASHI